MILPIKVFIVFQWSPVKETLEFVQHGNSAAWSSKYHSLGGRHFPNRIPHRRLPSLNVIQEEKLQVHPVRSSILCVSFSAFLLPNLFFAKAVPWHSIVMLVQVDDVSKLDYEAGQEGEDESTENPQKQEQRAERKDKKDEPALEEEEHQDAGGDQVNEDDSDKYEERQFAKPQVGRLTYRKLQCHATSLVCWMLHARMFSCSCLSSLAALGRSCCSCCRSCIFLPPACIQEPYAVKLQCELFLKPGMAYLCIARQFEMICSTYPAT